jgi:hypothetical protein
MKHENKEEALRNGLIDINAKLPAAVYLPFTNGKDILDNFFRFYPPLCRFRDRLQ